MTRVAAIAILTIGCLANAGQAAPAAHARRQAPPGAQDWTITFHFAGGFLGVMRTLHVRSTGDLSAKDAKRPDLPPHARRQRNSHKSRPSSTVTLAPDQFVASQSFERHDIPARPVPLRSKWQPELHHER